MLSFALSALIAPFVLIAGPTQGRSGAVIVPAGRPANRVSRTGLASKFPVSALSQSAIDRLVKDANLGSGADPVSIFSAKSMVVPNRGSMELRQATHVDPVDDRIAFRIVPETPQPESVVMQPPLLSGIDPKLPSIDISLDHLKKNRTYLVVVNLYSKNAKGHFASDFASHDLAMPSGSGNLPILLKPKGTEASLVLWFELADAKKSADVVVSSIEIQEVK